MWVDLGSEMEPNEDPEDNVWTFTGRHRLTRVSARGLFLDGVDAMDGS